VIIFTIFRVKAVKEIKWQVVITRIIVSSHKMESLVVDARVLMEQSNLTAWWQMRIEILVDKSRLVKLVLVRFVLVGMQLVVLQLRICGRQAINRFS
jgi:hypothetical protein